MVEASAPRRLVWIVDDSPLDAERIRRAIDAEHEVEVFHDGSAALERLAHGPPPDVMVLDWVMPGISGIEVCEFVRAGEPRIRELAILLLTSQRETRQVVEGLTAGANDYVAKPFVEEELRARVRALIRARHLRERAEAAEALARRLVAAGADPLLAVNAEGRIEFANDAARRLFPRVPDLAGLSIAEVLPDLPTHNVSVGAGEGLFPLPDVVIEGRIYSPAIRALPTDDAAHTSVALRDVTDRRQVEAPDRTTTATTTKTVTLRDVTEARRAEARRTDFYAIIAHDLRSPLSATLLRLDLILRGKYGVLPPRLIEEMRKIDQSLKWLVGMINDFLDLARLQGPGFKLERKDLELAALVDEVVDELTPLLDLHRLSWTSVRPEVPALVCGDRRRLLQVLSNLIANAIKFTPPGGVVTTRVKVGEGFVEVTVEDTGRGISPEALPTIFEKFTRDVDAQHEVSGSGLGLMIVRDIVRAHDGQVGVDSTPGVGTRFWFRLPRAPAPRG